MKDMINPKYTVEAGRQIYRYGKPFISIGREGETNPVEVDEMTRRIANMLNIADVLELNITPRNATT